MRLLRQVGGLALLFLALTLGAAGCRLAQHAPALTPSAAMTATTAATYGDHTGSMEIGGLTRTWLLHVPTKYSSLNPAPLLLALHGRQGNGKSMAEKTHLSQIADHEGF